MRQRARPGTKVIQGDPHPQIAQQAHLFAGFVGIVHQGLFRDLDLQMACLQTVALQHLTQFGDQIRHTELRAAQTDAQHQVLGKQGFPSLALTCPALVDPAAQPAD
ncbi:hypothetical protein D3C84_1011600 [compost metagenome]